VANLQDITVISNAKEWRFMLQLVQILFR
jgi:hypothetical protein